MNRLRTLGLAVLCCVSANAVSKQSKLVAPVLTFAERCVCTERSCDGRCAGECIEQNEVKRTRVEGRLCAEPHTNYIIQFFNNETNDDGSTTQSFLGQIKVKTNDSGKRDFKATFTCTVIGSEINATATEVHRESFGDTSEFSNSVTVGQYDTCG